MIGVPMDPKIESDMNIMFFQTPIKMKRVMSKLSADFISELSLKDYYFPFLSVLSEHDGISQRDIVMMIPFDKSRISVVVHELIDAGLVYDSADGRSTSLHLTDLGKEANAIGRMYARIAMDMIFQSFSEDEIRNMHEFFEKFNSRLDAIIAGKDV